MKIFSISLVAYCILSSSLNLFALNPNQISDYQQRLSNADPAVRLAAIDEVGRLAEESPEKVGNDVLPILATSLNDTDPKVRSNAFGHIAAISMQTVPRFASLKAGAIDLRSYAPLKALLEKGISDQDEEVRRNALGAYVFSFRIEAEFQQKLIRQFKTERGGNQEAIIEALAINGIYSQPTTDFLLQLLINPKYSVNVAAALSNTPVAPPATLLPTLVKLLEDASSSSSRQIFASAVANYGAKARPYLAEIEQLQNKETDPVTRQNLQRATDAIRTDKSLGR